MFLLLHSIEIEWSVLQHREVSILRRSEGEVKEDFDHPEQRLLLMR